MTNNIGEGLYLLRLREFENNKENTYKIGRANNLCNRMKQYPNGSVIYLMIECTDSKKHENKLINLFISKYKHNSMCGREYFNGNLDDMINDIINYIQNEMTETFCKMIKKNIIIDKMNKMNKNIMQDELEDENNIIILNKKNENSLPNSNKILNSINNNNINNNIDNIDRNCVCGKKFQYPYLLERHFKSSNICKNVYAEKIKNINNKNNNANKSKSINDIQKIICSICNSEYSNKQNLNRHYKTCKNKYDKELKYKQAQQDIITLNKLIDYMMIVLKN